MTGIVVLGGAFDTRVARTRDEPELNEAADRMTAGDGARASLSQAKVLFSGGQAAVFADDIPESRARRRPAAGAGPAERPADARFARRATPSRTPSIPRSWPIRSPARPGFSSPPPTTCPGPSAASGVAGFAVVPLPVDYRTPSGARGLASVERRDPQPRKGPLRIREYLGLLAYWLTGAPMRCSRRRSPRRAAGSAAAVPLQSVTVGAESDPRPGVPRARAWPAAVCASPRAAGNPLADHRFRPGASGRPHGASLAQAGHALMRAVNFVDRTACRAGP